MHGGQFLELLLLKWSDFDNSKIAAGYFTHKYGLDPNIRSIVCLNSEGKRRFCLIRFDSFTVFL